MNLPIILKKKIADDGYSPEAALLDIKRKNLNFSVTITKQTLYKYIYEGHIHESDSRQSGHKEEKEKATIRYIERQREPLQEQALNIDRLISIHVRNSDIGRWTLLWVSRESQRMHLLY